MVNLISVEAASLALGTAQVLDAQRPTFTVKSQQDLGVTLCRKLVVEFTAKLVIVHDLAVERHVGEAIGRSEGLGRAARVDYC